MINVNKKDAVEDMQFIMLNATQLRYLNKKDVKLNYDGSGDKRYLPEATKLYENDYRKIVRSSWNDIKSMDGDFYCCECNNCGEKHLLHFHYCPDCGAKMFKD